LFCFIIGAVALTIGFTNGASAIWLDEVQCSGTETRLIDCPASPIGTHNCAHIEDAGVRCTGTGTGELCICKFWLYMYEVIIFETLRNSMTESLYKN